MTLSDYDALKEEIEVSVGRSERYIQLISTLRELFRDEINSPRKLEKICSITELFKILEDRDIISEDNVHALKILVNSLPNRDYLLKRINNYEALHEPRPLSNYYITEHTRNHNHNSTKKEQDESSIITNPFTSSSMSKRKKDRIFQTITEEIGTFWKDLARNLKIRENKIDDIEMNNRTLSSKAIKILEEYKSRADPQRWFLVLCRALEDSRRKELSDSIKEIMVMNI